MSTIKVDAIRSNSASSDAITLATDGTCTANLTNRTNKNLLINGSFLIAQRGVSSTSSGRQTVDRFSVDFANTDEAPTQAQADVASGTTPYTLGFRKSYKITNGNQTSGAGSADFLSIEYYVEAQDMANSGWNYTSSSSNVTLSFWIKSSVAQSFKGFVRTRDGTEQRYPFDTGSLSADTWTKITKTIPGNSNLQFDNNNDKGLQIVLAAFWGTDYTDNSVTEHAWSAYGSGTRMKDNTSTWYTTNDATLEVTGFQLEVSDHATDFEHKSFADELYACQRYYDKSYTYGTTPGTATSTGAVVHTLSGSYNYAGFPIEFTRSMRTDPTITLYSTNNGNTGKTSADSGDGNASVSYQNEKRAFVFRANANNGMGTNVFLRCQFQADAEL